MQGTQVRSLIWKDPTWATKPVDHNYWVCALEFGSHKYWAHGPQLLKLVRAVESTLCNEKPLQWEACTLQLGNSPCSPRLENSLHGNKDPEQPKINQFKKKWTKGSLPAAFNTNTITASATSWRCSFFLRNFFKIQFLKAGYCIDSLNAFISPPILLICFPHWMSLLLKSRVITSL